MTDRQAAEAAGLNPDTAAYTKAKPRVRAYMLEHRATGHYRLLQQESEEQRRQNLGRERVLARLWEIADLDPDMTRNSMSAQIKALTMIVAIEGLIPIATTTVAPWPPRTNQPLHLFTRQSIPPPGFASNRGVTGPQPGRDPAPDEVVFGVPHPPPGEAANAPSHLGSAPGPDFDSSPSIFARPSSTSETTPSAPHAPVSASAPDNRVPSSMEKKPDTWRLKALKKRVLPML